MFKGELILIRHLATPNNLDGVMMGKMLDIDIIEDPKSICGLSKKIKLIKKKWKISSSNTLICTSPLKRCLTTSSIIAKILQLSDNPLVIEGLVETNMGDFSGKTATELRRMYGLLVDDWMFRPEGFRFPGGESYKDLRIRVKKVLEKLSEFINLDGYKYICVCTHVDVIKMMLSEVMGFSFNKRRSFVIDNGSVSILSLDGDNNWIVKGINIL